MLSIPNKLNAYGRIWRYEWIRPYESMWGICQRYKQVNVLNDTQLIRDLWENTFYSDRVKFSKCYGVYTSSDLNIKKSTQAIMIPENHFEFLKPIIDKTDNSSAWDREIQSLIDHDLKYCPTCIETYGFHSFLHQFTGLDRCPWHPYHELIISYDVKYEIKTGSKYAFGNEKPDDPQPPLPIYTSIQNTIDPVVNPFKSITMIFNTFPEVNMFSYLTNVRDDFKIIAETDEEMLANYGEIRKHILKYIYHEGHINHQYLEEASIDDVYEVPYSCTDDNRFFTAAYIHVWICEQLLIFSKEEIRKYITLLSADPGNRKPEILPNENLVAVLRYSRAVTHALRYEDVDSLDYVLHPNSRNYYYSFSESMHLNMQKHITEKIFKAESFGLQRNINPELCYIWSKIVSDYFQEILQQIQSDPYEKNLTGIREPNYLLAQLSDGRWGYYKFI